MAPPTSGFAWGQVFALPDWLADDQGKAFEQTFGQTKDDELDLLKEGVQARWPDAARPDALPYQGHDRLLLRAPPETDTAYTARLLMAPEIWLWGGTKTFIADLFAPYGYRNPGTSDYAPGIGPTGGTEMSVANNHEVIWDGNTSWSSRVFILCMTAGYWSVDGGWDDPGTWDDGGIWDSDATVDDLDYLRRMIREGKSPHAYPVTIAMVLAGGTGDGFWDSPGDWDDPGNWDDGTTDLSYWTLGHVWGEEAWLSGTGVEGYGEVWDEGSSGDVWEDPYVAPSTGWGDLV